jgi:hypothetical protein
MKHGSSTTSRLFAVPVAAMAVLLAGACAAPAHDAPAGVDPCGRLTAASVKAAFGLDTHVASGYGSLPTPPVQGPDCIFTADTQLAGSMNAWTYQLHPLSVDPAHPPAGGMPAPESRNGTPISGLGDSAVLVQVPTAPPMTIPPLRSETSGPRVSVPEASILLMVWKGSWVYEFKLDYTTDAPGGLSADRAKNGLIEVARAGGL